MTVEANDASRRGVQYEVANGHRIPNLGQQVLNGLSDAEGLSRTITAQVCEVNRPLLSVKRLLETGHAVVLSDSGGYVEHLASGERLALTRSDGMFMLKLWVPTPVF